MRKDGLPVESFYVVAGIPTTEKAVEIIVGLKAAGIKHVAFKPSSINRQLRSRSSLQLSTANSSSSCTNGFRMVGGAKSLAVGDLCKAEACIISVINTSDLEALRRKIVKANASSKSCRHSCTMDVFRITRTPSTSLRNLIMSFLSSRTQALASFNPRSSSGGRTSPHLSLLARLVSSASSRRCHSRIGPMKVIH